MSLDPDAAHAHVLAEHRDLVTTVLDCADAVAAGWDGDATTDADRVGPPLRATLARAGVVERLPGVLRECVVAAGGRLRAEPVAAPPYVVVTSVGPLLRATLSGGRLVVTCRAFRVERGDGGPRYVRDATDVAAAVGIEVR